MVNSDLKGLEKSLRFYYILSTTKIYDGRILGKFDHRRRTCEIRLGL